MARELFDMPAVQSIFPVFWGFTLLLKFFLRKILAELLIAQTNGNVPAAIDAVFEKKFQRHQLAAK